MGKLSRNKGKRGEREAVHQAREHWFAPDARRTAQVDGGLTADLHAALPEAHVEVKWRARIGVLRFFEQVDEDRQPHEYGVVLLREDGNKEWFVLLRIADSSRFAQSLSTNHVAHMQASS